MEYSWEDSTIKIGLTTVEGITGWEFTESRDLKAYYGRGSKPKGIGAGNKSFEGTLTLMYSEYQKLLNALPPGAGITDAKFNITLVLAGISTAAHNIINFRPSKSTLKMASGDAFMEIELPGMFEDFITARN